MARVLVAVFAVLVASSPALAQSEVESELVTSIKQTIGKGFSFNIKAAVEMPDGLPREREALKGVDINGEFYNGVIHATDGRYEIYRTPNSVACKTEKGFLPYAEFSSEMRAEAKQAFDPDDSRWWSRGNVTKGREAVARLIRLDNLIHRANIQRLTNVGRAFNNFTKAGKSRIGGEPAEMHEGDLTDLTCFNVLQGPFDELVNRGTLSFSNVSGIGRVYLGNNVIKRVHVKAMGKYFFFPDEDNVQRKGMCSLELLAEITKIGETKFDVPPQAARILGLGTETGDEKKGNGEKEDK
jgi:hypothetical protein